MPGSWLIIGLIACWGLCLLGVLELFRNPGFWRKVHSLIVALMGASIGAALVAFWLLVHTFDVFSKSQPVATVEVERISKDEFELTYKAVGSKQTRVPKIFRLRGDQWTISGGMVKWSSWLNMIGFSNYHKPMRISGQFSDIRRQRLVAPTVHALGPERDVLWECLYRMDPYLPFIEAAYGSSASVSVEPQMTYEIYVSPFGYFIQRRITTDFSTA